MVGLLFLRSLQTSPEGRLTKHSPYFSQLLIIMYIFYNAELTTIVTCYFNRLLKIKSTVFLVKGKIGI